MFYVLMIFSMIFWGASWVNVKVLTTYINEYETVFLRLGFSFITMIPIIKYLKLDFKIDKKSLFLAFVAALILVVYSVFFFLGVKHGTAGLGGALVTTLVPINTFVILSILNKKTISLKHSFALVLGAFGVLTMLNIWYFDMNDIFSKQNIFFIVASLLWPLLTLVSAKVTKTDILVFTFYIYLIATVLVYIFFIDFNALEELAQFDYIFWLNLFILSVLSTTFATSIYFIGVSKLGIKEVSSFIFLVPSSALVLSAIFLDEHITFNTLLGTICTVIAIYILNNLKLSVFSNLFNSLFNK